MLLKLLELLDVGAEPELEDDEEGLPELDEEVLVSLEEEEVLASGS